MQRLKNTIHIHKKHTMIPTVRFTAYTDGACKDNHVNVSNVTRKAGSSVVILPKSNEMRETLLKIFDEFQTKKNIDDWRTILREQKNEFCKAICRTIPLPQPVAEPNKVSNNRAELHGFNSVLAYFVSNFSTKSCLLELDVHVDSQYVIKVFENARKWRNNEWKISSGTRACNIDCIVEMLQYLDVLAKIGHSVRVFHVAAHTKESEIPTDFEKWQHWFGNDVADRLSNIAAGVETDVNYKPSKKPSKKRKSE